MSKKVVTANYQDRTSENKWLIRNSNEAPEKAVAYRAVKATSITFGESSSYEQGFGCTIVAHCETAEGLESLGNLDKKNLQKLLFCRTYFISETTDERVDTIAVLYLDTDGTMFAEVSKPVENTQVKTEDVKENVK